MSRLRRIAGASRQVLGAVRRNGLGKVVRFGRDLLLRYGVMGALRYAIAPADLRRARLAELQGQEAQTPAPKVETGFGGWTVEAGAWARHLAACHGREQGAGSVSARVHVVFDSCEPPAEAADTDWVVLLWRGDAPSPHLLTQVAAAGAPPHVEVVTFDMAAALGEERVLPILQPGANPWLARYADVGFGRYAFRAAALRCGEGDAHARLRAWLAARPLTAASDGWQHVSEPLVDAALGMEEIDEARAQARRRALAALNGAPTRPERVSAVICTHNRGRLVRQLVRTLDDPRIAEVVVVANNTTSPPALETLDWVRARARCQVLVRDEPFNFSRLSNAGARLTTGERLLFLNDDVAPISDDWLEPLLQPLRDPGVGIAGPLLLYPNEEVQHAGMYLGYRGGAGHNLRHLRLPEDDHLFYGSLPREVSAVTGAVMMVRREPFEALNGFDELLPTFLQDVDLCLRARAVGLATVWTPLAELLHMESTTIHQIDGDAFRRLRTLERERFLARWGGHLGRDPLRNPAFEVEDETQRTLAASRAG